jgi:hypothetical protein
MADPNNEAGTSPYNPGAVAIGLLWNDLAFIPVLFLLLAASAVLDVMTQSAGDTWRAGVVVVDRLMQIVVVSIIVLRWRRLLQASPGPKVRAGAVVVRIATVSIAASLVLTTPFFGMAMTQHGAGAFAFLALFIFGAVWSLRVYLFFAVAGMLGLPFGASFARSIELSRANTWEIIRSLIAPIGITIACSTLFLMPYPDGRSLAWMAAAGASEGVFWILSTYTALGLALTLFSDKEWRAAGLSHYRADRLSTLHAQGGKILPKYLAPRSGFIMLAVALCFLAGNLARLGQQPPAAQIKLRSVAVSDYKISVSLDLEDKEYQFRGLQPQAFFIASKTGSLQSARLLSASQQEGKEEKVGFIKASGAEPVTLFLTFASGKTGDVLRGLDNMWLWYRAQPLLAITPEMLQGALQPNQNRLENPAS